MRDTEVPTRGKNESASGRAVFVDIDGTLCDSRQRIPESALEAHAQLRARGHRLFACTGRSAPEVYPRFWAVGSADEPLEADRPQARVDLGRGASRAREESVAA